MTKSFTFQPQPSDILIAVMGITGSGKSTFISHCTRHSISASAGLHSEPDDLDTQEVSVYPCKADIGDNIYLIDTPGFDDTELDDAQVLRKIATWVGETYQQKIYLRGILYLHRIIDIRMQGAAIRNLFMFKKLCGQNAIKNIILVTTMWEDVKPEAGQQRENELRTTPQYWGEMIAKGASMVRHQNNHNSARSIIQTLLNKTTKTTLAIQREMVDEKKELQDTSAGRELDGILNQQREHFLRQIEDLKRDMTEAREMQDRESQEQIRLLQEQRRVEIDKIFRQQESMKVGLQQLHDQKFAKLEKQLAAQKNQMEMDRKEIAGLRERLAGTSIGVNNPSSGANTVDTGSLTKPNREAGLKTTIRLEGHGGYRRHISRAAFSADARYLVVDEVIWYRSGEGEYSRNRVKVYDSATGVAQSVLAADRIVSQVALSSDGRLVAMDSVKIEEYYRSGLVRVLDAWDSRTGKCLWTKHHQDLSPLSLFNLVISPDGCCLAFIEIGDDRECHINILQSATGSTLRTLTTIDVPIRQMRFSPDGGRIMGMNPHSIYIWNSATGSLGLTLTGFQPPSPYSNLLHMAFSHDGKGVAVMSPSSGAYIISFCDTETGRRLWTTEAMYSEEHFIFSPDGYIASLCSSYMVAGASVVNPARFVRVRDATTGKLLKSIPIKEAKDLVFSPDSNRFEILACDEDVVEIIAV
ncbi:hypothetical protein PFICI_12696 [Pestalotiopsis fici W106-1]|uniref:G domain-containing protein n=1 Tax=Pestalotiopsis fici (strain W106-1 / CGMCC3.15140) TaxID=1229662 RepID=W3WRK3_PESFW|nr:uncharacterized protein PFICI_12696 [Pestalotiopsis fici W106-1]ETS75752.1 hypothetical protein PFICI_12696 [Pestalotiopsis fici W106-1]